MTNNETHWKTIIVVSWLLLISGGIVLMIAYPNLSNEVAVYGLPWQHPKTAPKTFLTVGRIPMMGLGQLGAATAMAYTAASNRAWRRFWHWLGLTAGAKTLLECLTMLMASHAPSAQLLTFATIVVVGCFVFAAIYWMYSGVLHGHPPLLCWPRAWVLVSIATWAFFAVLPAISW